MSIIQQYHPFSKQEFESVLNVTSGYMEFIPEWYEQEWIKDEQGMFLPIRRKRPISEYCYIVPLAIRPTKILKIYSSVKKRTGYSRDVGGDAIRVVLADSGGAPIHRAFKRINRTGNWEWKLRKRISTAIAAAGFDTKCPLCGHPLFLKRNKHDNSRFLGCSQYDKKKCMGKREPVPLRGIIRPL